MDINELCPIEVGSKEMRDNIKPGSKHRLICQEGSGNKFTGDIAQVSQFAMVLPVFSLTKPSI
jgi:hypothetical protein